MTSIRQMADVHTIRQLEKDSIRILDVERDGSELNVRFMAAATDDCPRSMHFLVETLRLDCVTPSGAASAARTIEKIKPPF